MKTSGKKNDTIQFLGYDRHNDKVYINTVTGDVGFFDTITEACEYFASDTTDVDIDRFSKKWGPITTKRKR